MADSKPKAAPKSGDAESTSRKKPIRNMPTVIRKRCNQCEFCLRPDCGQCRHCLRKRKFGGDGSRREACVQRKCTNMTTTTVGQKKKRVISSNGAATSPTSRDDQQKATQASGAPVPTEATSSAAAASAVAPPSKSGKSNKRARFEESGDSPLRIIHGKVIPPRTEAEVCAGCLGTRDKELGKEPILLCDGAGCNREFHLKCCLPALSEVPEGNYFCIDCSQLGSTASLEEYLDWVHEERAEFESSYDYVNERLTSALEEGNSKSNDEDVPLSELERISILHYLAMAEGPQFQLDTENSSSVDKATSPNVHTFSNLGPEFLIGKLVRLYCPLDNQYHTGRILDFRLSTHSDEFWCSGPIGKHEFYVRFSAGSQEGRKTVLRQWIVLEEHSLAIGVSIIWGQYSGRKGIFGWRPAITWLRTSLELVSVMSQLSQSHFQVYKASQQGSPSLTDLSRPAWTLVSFWGGNNSSNGQDQTSNNRHLYALLSIKDEAVSFFSESFSIKLSERIRSAPNNSDAQFERMELYKSLARTEWKEEERIKSWHRRVNDYFCNKPDKAFKHPKAITMVDEDALGPIHMTSKQSESETASTCIAPQPVHVGTRRIHPCPLIPQGLDRQWLLDQLEHLGDTVSPAETKFRCQLVQPSPIIMEQYWKQEQQLVKKAVDRKRKAKR